MSKHERQVEWLIELAGKVADGSSIDWVDAERTFTGPLDRLRKLRSIEQISHAHRALVDPEPDGSREGLPFPSWGPLELRAPVARGGFGEVFRAHDSRLDRAVALKLFRSAASSDSGFLEEARRLAGVRHPNVVTVFGVDRFLDRDGLWMEWIEGETLERDLEVRGPLGPHEAALVGIEACCALAAVHAAGLVHRDVKLENLVRERGGRIVLMDFGSSTRTRGAGPGETDRLSGTPMYLAPEAFEGRDSGVRMDIYALGVALYRLTSGEFALRSGTAADLQRQHREHSGIPLRDRNPVLPTPFVRIVERAMDPDPARRFASAGEMERALDAFVAGVSEPPAPPVGAWWSHRSTWVAATLVLVALGVVAIFRPASWRQGAGLEANATFYRIDAKGRAERIAEGSRIAPGDQVFLEIEAQEPVWVYVINEPAEGISRLLFPLGGLERSNPLPGGGIQSLPGPVEGRKGAWDVTSAGGVETLLVLASRRPIPFVEERIRTLARAGTADPAEPAESEFAERLRGLGGLSPARTDPSQRRSTTDDIREWVALRDGGDRDPRIWELRLSNPG